VTPSYGEMRFELWQFGDAAATAASPNPSGAQAAERTFGADVGRSPGRLLTNVFTPSLSAHRTDTNDTQPTAMRKVGFPSIRSALASCS
jgi:hypothetical protein